MEEVVVDASVIVKWFVKEVYSEQALKIRDSYINGEIMIVAPNLLPFEVLNALRYTNFFNENDLKMIAEAMESYGFKLIPLEGKYASRTIEISLKKEITIYDAAYVALAVVLKTQLYTADKKMISKLGEEYAKFVAHISDVK